MPDRNRASLLKEVRNPLIFFALALLVAESCILGLAGLGLPEQHRVYAIWAMLIVFLVVVVVVAAITLWRPGNLYDTVTELRQNITSRGFRDAIEDVIIRRVKADCLQVDEEIASIGEGLDES